MALAPKPCAGIGLLAVLTGACVGDADRPEPPPPPAVVTLGALAPDTVREEDNPAVHVMVVVDSAQHAGLMVGLEYSGTAERDRDYTASVDSLRIPPGSNRARVTLDIFRDFEAEGNETIVVSLGGVAGHGRAGTSAGSTLTILDGPAAEVAKGEEAPSADPSLVFPFNYQISETAVQFGISAVIPADQPDAPRQLFAEHSSDPDFETDVNLLETVDLSEFPSDAFTFISHEFRLPLSAVAPNEGYYIRTYLADVPLGPGEDPGFSSWFFSFATGPDGLVVTRCRAASGAGGAGADPLFPQQWHLANTGQTAFSRSGGVAGADLRMGQAIANRSNGRGVRLAVVDSGLEICHPDLAANVEPGASHNFGFRASAGALPGDPFNTGIIGDHGTSVAGVAAAVAGNGTGGRGVAPEVLLRGFNPGGSFGDQFDIEALSSLGASDSFPDSASVDIFNMSFGSEFPSANSDPDIARVFRMGTTDLRDGRGALYVKAAGNEFGLCDGHPLNRDIGCLGSNSDPDNNLPYLLVTGAFNASDVKSSYSSAGANLWIVAPAGEDGVEAPGIITTDQQGVEPGFNMAFDPDTLPLAPGSALNPNGDYISIFGGTSSAAPATSGAIAVLLGLYPDLTWRDVRHILALSARRIDPDRAQVRAAFNGTPYVAQHAWQTNAAGYGYHNWYGFGALALDEAIALAADHAPDSLGAFTQSQWFPADAPQDLFLPIPDEDGAGVTHTLEVAGLPDGANIEAVIVELDVEHGYASDLGVTLVSPAGTESVVNAPFNTLLDGYPGLMDWQLLSNAFYGESPNGEWTIQVVDLAAGDTGALHSWRLRFHYGDHPETQ